MHDLHSFWIRDPLWSFRPAARIPMDENKKMETKKEKERQMRWSVCVCVCVYPSHSCRISHIGIRSIVSLRRMPISFVFVFPLLLWLILVSPSCRVMNDPTDKTSKQMKSGSIVALDDEPIVNNIS